MFIFQSSKTFQTYLKIQSKIHRNKKRQYTYIGAKIMSDMHIEEHFSPFKSNQCLALDILQRKSTEDSLWP